MVLGTGTLDMVWPMVMVDTLDTLESLELDMGTMVVWVTLV